MTADSIRTRIAGQRAMQAVVDAEASARLRTRVERILGVRALSPGARRAYNLALGDAAVGQSLEQLGQHWDVLHDVPLGHGRTLDHIAIGPGGVYAIRAVHCAGSDVVVDGRSLTIGGLARDDLLELAESACIAERLLGVAGADANPPVMARVLPLFVAVDAGRLVLRAPPVGAGVIELPHLRRTLAHGEPRLSGDTVASISDLAERATTWPSAGDDDHASVRREFQGIRDRVRVALRRRTAWAITVFAIGAGTMTCAIAAFVTFVVLA